MLNILYISGTQNFFRPLTGFGLLAEKGWEPQLYMLTFEDIPS